MTELHMVQVDAFADRPFTGNPAAVIPLERWLPDETMQAIALENNLSETAFAVPTSGDADYELRWFTPTTEVEMCGHATLASGHVLIEGDEVRFRTRKAGVLTVRRDGPRLTLDLPAIPVRPERNNPLLSALRIEKTETFLSVSDARATAIILVENEIAVRSCRPDMTALREIPLMTIITAPGLATDVVSRVFVPAWGVDEDPVTGSAHAALTPFWCERLGRESFTAFQASLRGGRIDCRLAGDRAILTGGCVTVIDATLRF
jgi:PhzF family phenazine biosynthesis protein